MPFTSRCLNAKPSAECDPPAILGRMSDSGKLVHEDVGAAVYAAIPPRKVPFSKRFFWHIVLWLLRSERGRKWIAGRYGGSRGG